MVLHGFSRCIWRKGTGRNGMATIGYAQLISRLCLVVRPLAKPAQISGSVNRRVDSADRVLFPCGVAIEGTLVGHLEFALRHEGVNLDVIDALFEHLTPEDLLARLNAAPNGAHIRRACHLWEWLTEPRTAGSCLADGRLRRPVSCPMTTSPPGSPPTTVDSACATMHWGPPISPRWCARQ